MINISNFSDVACKVGFFTDLHYCNISPSYSTNRYYPEAPEKLADAISKWDEEGVDAIVSCGDYIDHGNGVFTKQQALTDLAVIEAVYETANCDRYYAFGNHETNVLTKDEFIENSGMTERYYSFDKNGVHFIVLDACYRSDNDLDEYSENNWTYTITYIPPLERQWLINDLENTQYPTVIFCHQRLSNRNVFTYNMDVCNAPVIRSILENSGKVKAVFCGHLHEHGNTRYTVNGIPYFEMMAETNGAYPENSFAIINIKKDGSISVDGYGLQESF